MGILDTVLGFGKNRQGRIVTFALIGFGALIFFMGVLMAAIGSSIVTPDRIELAAPNMEYKKDFFVNGKNLTGYHMDVSEKQTSITVKPSPRTASAPATFRTNNPNLVSVTNKVSGSGTAILELKRVNKPGFANGFYEFHDPNDPLKDLDKIRIDVSCGGKKAVIYVRIVLNPEHIEVFATLQKQNQFREWENTTQYIDMADFHPFREPDLGFRNYRLNLSLRIFDIEIMSLNPNNYIYDTDPLPYTNFFVATEVFSDIWTFSDIKLLGNKERLHKARCQCFDPLVQCFCCTDPCNCIDAGFMTVSDSEFISYYFKITCVFDGQEYFTIPDFELKIKAWND